MQGQQAGVEAVVSLETRQVGVGQFSTTLADAETLRVGGYLRRVRLLAGLGPNGYYRKKRQETAQAEKRARRAAQRRGEVSRPRP